MGKCDGILKGKQCLEEGSCHSPIALGLRSNKTPTVSRFEITIISKITIVFHFFFQNYYCVALCHRFHIHDNSEHR